MSNLAAIRSATASVSSGKEANDEAWMTMWCSSNWGELLQPAPLSIALLGSVMIIASSTKDFSLITAPPKGAPAFQWNHVRAPDSFKTCLMQLVGDGYTAFEGAHKNMTAIRDLSGQMPEVISQLVQLLNGASKEEIEMLFPKTLAGLKSLALKCQRAAESCEGGFKDLADLTQELVMACTYKAGSSEQIIAQNQVTLAVLEEDRKGTEERIKLTEDTLKTTKESFLGAEQQFKDAVKDMPSGWDLVGMGVVESLTGLLVSAGNAAVSAATMKSQMMTAGLGAAGSIIGGKPAAPGAPGAPGAPATTPAPAPAPGALPSAAPNGPAVSDPATPMVGSTLAQANALLSLLTGAQPNTADWTRIGDKGGQYVQSTLTQQKTKLDMTKPISQSLGPIITSLIGTCDSILTDAKSGGNDAAVPGYKATTNQAIQQLQALSQTTALLTQTQGTVSGGLAPVPTPPAAATSGKTAEIAVANAKFKVDQTKQVLESARKAFMDTSKERQEQQKEITKTIADMTNLKLTNMNIMEMIPVLRKSIATFNQLRAQFSQLVQFFSNIANLITNVMTPSVERLVDTLGAAKDMVLGGVGLKAFTKNMIYQQCMTPLKVAMLSTKIAGAYVEVSTNFIMPAQRKVAEMMDFPPPGDDEAARSAYVKKLEAKQAQLRKDSETQSSAIADKIAADQATFEASINNRTTKIVNGLKAAYPEVTSAPPKHLAAVTDNYVQDTVAVQAETANTDLTASFNDLM
jgi:hypothetical protein